MLRANWCSSGSPSHRSEAVFAIKRSIRPDRPARGREDDVVALLGEVHLPGLELLARVGLSIRACEDSPQPARASAAREAATAAVGLVQLDEHRATCHTVALLHVDGPDGGVVR
jgi:hypothetical protein